MKILVFLPLSLLVLVIFGTARAEDRASLSDRLFARVNAVSDFGAYQLHVRTSESELTLEGWVANPKSLILLEQFAKEADPSRKLINHVTLKSSVQSGAGLAQAVYQAISRDDSLKGYALVVEMHDDTVVLKGKVNDKTIIPRIIERARKVPGVHQLVSELTQRPPPTDAEMEKEAKEALKRAGFIGAPGVLTHLDVTVEHAIAYLRGEAEIPQQIDSALSAVLSVYGVRDVRNYATIPQYPAAGVHIGIPRQQ